MNILISDIGCDGDVDVDDIDDFVLGLNEPDGYIATNGVPSNQKGNIDMDGDIDFDDIDNAVVILQSPLHNVLEPTAMIAMMLTAVAALGQLLLCRNN